MTKTEARAAAQAAAYHEAFKAVNAGIMAAMTARGK
jgi:hypothetical protein